MPFFLIFDSSCYVMNMIYSLLKRWCNPVKLLHHFLQSKFKLVESMMQSNYCTHFSKQVQTCKKHNAVKPIYCIIIIFNLFQGWCNHTKVGNGSIIFVPVYSMFDFIAKDLNLFKRWCNLVKLSHHFFWKQVQTFSKHDAIKPIYCIITIFKQVSTCSKDDAIMTKEAMALAELA